jgi:pyruvate/2-oxoacid:ferredoxin oxidoreductase beta subunit
MHASTLAHETSYATAEPSDLTVAFEDAHAAALGIVIADAQAKL